MKRTRDQWDAYLETFHAQRPGITEDVLIHCLDSTGTTPLRVAPRRHRPRRSHPRPRLRQRSNTAVARSGWVGIDRSQAELCRAQSDGRVPLIRADLRQLPIRSPSIDTVICSMALMLVEPLNDALVEIQRALMPMADRS